MQYIVGAVAGLYLLAAVAVGLFFGIGMKDDFIRYGWPKSLAPTASFIWAAIGGLFWFVTLLYLLRSKHGRSNYGKG